MATTMTQDKRQQKQERCLAKQLHAEAAAEAKRIADKAKEFEKKYSGVAQKTSKKKKKASANKAGAKKTDKTYAEMIAAAIVALKRRSGASRAVLKNYLVDKFELDAATDVFARSFRTALRRGVETGLLVQTEQRFRLSPKGRLLAPKRTVHAKAAKAKSRKPQATGNKKTKRTEKSSSRI